MGSIKPDVSGVRISSHSTVVAAKSATGNIYSYPVHLILFVIKQYDFCTIMQLGMYILSRQDIGIPTKCCSAIDHQGKLCQFIFAPAPIFSRSL